MGAIGRTLREPLVHFIVLGAAVFGAFQLVGERGEPPEGKIAITPGKVEHLVTGFTRTWRRPPTARELDGLVEDHIREEVFYREALALGLDKDDTIVRRRMRQKLEFLAGDATAIVAPTDVELQAWLERHPDKFRIEPSFAFSQVYFSRARGGESAAVVASKALAELERAKAQAAPQDLGEATMLPREMPLSAVGEIGRVFGDDFARQVARLAPGRWAGPVQSGYGWHLVRVSLRTDGGPRPLAEVREAAQRDWQAAKSREVVDATYAKLRGKYTIVLEGAARP
jgi:hypothetical protein